MLGSLKKIVLTDVFYGESHVQAAGLLIEDWKAEHPAKEYIHRSDRAEEYVPGEFYQRELPHLLSLLSSVPAFDCVVVDAHVWLQENRPGCGYYLWKHLEEKVPVIGVAKNAFHKGVAKRLLRGESKNPLYISAAGIDVEIAVSCIAQMHGLYRIPTLLKQVDQLSRA